MLESWLSGSELLLLLQRTRAQLPALICIWELTIVFNFNSGDPMPSSDVYRQHVVYNTYHKTCFYFNVVSNLVCEIFILILAFEIGSLLSSGGCPWNSPRSGWPWTHRDTPASLCFWSTGIPGKCHWAQLLICFWFSIQDFRVRAPSPFHIPLTFTVFLFYLNLGWECSLYLLTQ